MPESPRGGSPWMSLAHSFDRKLQLETRGWVSNSLSVSPISPVILPVRVFLLYGVDPLKAVPLEDFRTTSALHKVRWPQIVAEVSEKRESLRKLSSRSTRTAK